MKVVREYINEKFTEESDPVHDMGIGIELVIKQFCEENEPDDAHDKEAWLWICVKYQEKEYVKYLINAGWDINYADSAALSQAIVNDDYDMIKLLLDNGAKIKTGYFWNQIRKKHRESYEFIRNYKGVKRIRENINEKFTEESDPLHDMGIGPKGIVEELKKKYHWGDYDIFIKMLTDEKDVEKAKTVMDYLLEHTKLKTDIDDKYLAQGIMHHAVRDVMRHYVVEKAIQYKAKTALNEFLIQASK